MTEALTHLIKWYQDRLDAGGYPLIAAMMAIESTFIPLPSEVIIPFAAQRAHALGNLSLFGVVLAGTIGSWVGATIMYWAARTAGRPLVVRYGSYFLVPEAKLHAAEGWAVKFGAFGVFVARLLPVVRHLIGIPMGIVKMDFVKYSAYTLLGSCFWCIVLAWVGVQAGKDPRVIAGALVVLGTMYFFVHRHFAGSAPPKEL